MAYSDFPVPKRSRRRRNGIIFIVLAVIIGLLALAVRYRTERRESIDYLNAAEDLAVQNQDMSARLAAVFQGLGTEERPAMVQRLKTLAERTAEARKTLNALPVTRPVAEASGLMTVAINAWDDAMQMMDDAIIQVLDANPGDTSGDEQLAAAFEQLRLGDLAYAGFLDAVARLDPDLVPMDFPTVAYVDDVNDALYDAPAIAGRLRQIRTLSEDRDVSIIAATIPAPVSEQAGGIWVVPESDSFALEVTVSNTGNVVAEKITVTVSLQRAASSEDPAVFSQLIAALDPQESGSRLFEDLVVEPGVVYKLTAVASFEEGINDATKDNEWSLVFERNSQ